MKSKNIVLNIAVNLARIGRHSQEGKQVRASQFVRETREYLDQLPQQQSRFGLTRKKFEVWLSQSGANIDPEEAYTWANILTHRAKLIS